MSFQRFTVDLDSKDFGTTLEQTPYKNHFLIVAVFSGMLDVCKTYTAYTTVPIRKDFTSFFAHIIYKLLKLHVLFGLLFVVEGHEEATSIQTKLTNKLTCTCKVTFISEECLLGDHQNIVNIYSLPFDWTLRC